METLFHAFEVVFVRHFVKGTMLKEVFAVEGMDLGRMGVALDVVVEECWGSFVELHLLLFEALLFGTMKSVG